MNNDLKNLQLLKEVEDKLAPGEVKNEYIQFIESLEQRYSEASLLRPSTKPELPPSRSLQRPEPNGFDADRLPGYGSNGGSFLGPDSFKRREPLGENGEPVSGTFIPAGARFDPYYPIHSKPRIPSGYPQPSGLRRPNPPPFSGPDPDHLRVPDYHDLY
ncbi:hypothetical protein WA171_002839 [Blastocystis sp. BT1]